MGGTNRKCLLSCGQRRCRGDSLLMGSAKADHCCETAVAYRMGKSVDAQGSDTV